MTEEHLKTIADAKKVVADIFHEKVDKNFTFHTLAHTTEVFDAAMKISNFYLLSGDDKFILSIASLFHDTGFSIGQMEGHEAESAKLAVEFLHLHDVGDHFTSKVAGCILATKMPQQPTEGLQKVLCDADLYHVGRDNFEKKTELLRQELQFYNKTEIETRQWQLLNIAFLKSHSFFTGYCQQKLEGKKQRWIKKLEKEHAGTLL